MKKFLLFFALLLFLIPNLTRAEAEVLNLYFFYGDGCPHCQKEEEFFAGLLTQPEYSEKLKINYYETWYDSKNAKLLASLDKEYNFNVQGVPFLIIGDRTFSGFQSAETTGQEIKLVIDEALRGQCTDLVASFLQGGDDGGMACSSPQESNEIHLPLVGSLSLDGVSLPVLTILIAGVDGFNPCAMWILLFLISLLLGMKNRRRMWILGGSFILVSGLVYFLFLAAWLKLFLFIGFIIWVRLAVALVAIGGGIYHVRDFFRNKEGTCQVTDNEKRKNTFFKIKNIVKKDNLWLALAGIVLLAASVNLVELLCSAGLPAVYTQVLALSDLPSWKYYLYLILYIIIFMLDDLIIFIIAMTTLKMKGINSRYTRWATLIGGGLMIIIGLLLVFKPGWLMFG